MRLKKLILSGYKRFGLSKIQKLTYTPDSIEQVILGSNGSGKSSLLSEIMNLVPNAILRHTAIGSVATGKLIFTR